MVEGLEGYEVNDMPLVMYDFHATHVYYNLWWSGIYNGGTTSKDKSYKCGREKGKSFQSNSR